MNCRAAQRLISAERDGALSPGERTVLEAHVAGCAACSQARQALAAAAAAWTRADQAVKTPDVERAWQDIRRARRADSGREARPAVAWWSRALWAGVPAVGAAAVALMVFSGGPKPAHPESTAASWAQFVEFDDSAAAPVIYVDEASGWVVVWAGESNGGNT